MALRLISCIIFFIFPIISYAEISIVDNDIYISGKKLETDLHPNITGSYLSDSEDTFQISNYYNASYHTKTEINYLFNKFNGKILRLEQINYSTEYDRYYGYVINFNNSKKITDINDDYIENLDSKFGFKDYNFTNKENNIVLNLKLESSDLHFNTYNNKYIFIVNYTLDQDKLINKKYEECELLNSAINYSTCKQIEFINSKSYLYNSPNISNGITKMYLVRGDQITIKDAINLDGSKWYFINYKGKKDINMWLKAEAIDTNGK